MKTQIFKNVMPFAVAAAGIFGAFTTTSMQTAEQEIAPENAYRQNDCQNIVKQCETEQLPFLCRIGSNQLYGKDGNGNCVVTLYQEN